MENGIMTTSHNYLSSVSNFDGFENYLFSNWMMPYVFNDYLESGFNKDTYVSPHLIDVTKMSNSSIKNALYYLQAICYRHQREWDDFNDLISNINAVKQWEYCGVFENLNSSGIDLPFEPEWETSNTVEFDAQSKGFTHWYKKPQSAEVYNFFTNHVEYGSGVHYAQTFVNSPVEQRVNFKIGKGGLIRVWVNDVLVLENDEEFITEMDAYTYSVNLQKGVNRILVKIANESGTPYFILRLEDLIGNPLKDYDISFENRNYKKGSFESVNPILVSHKVIDFFENRLQGNIGDENLNKFCLSRALIRVGELDKAIKILKEWLIQYPNSSFIKSALIECYNTTNDETTKSELENNLKRLDPNYYLSLLLEFEDSDDLMKLDIDTYEEKLNAIGKSVDYSFMKTIADLMILSRTGNRETMTSKLDELLIDETLFSSLKPTFAEFYASAFNDYARTTEVLEKYNKEEFNWEIVKYLAYYYEKQNRTDEAIALYDDSIINFKYDNNSIYNMVQLLHRLGKYERSLKYIDIAIKNFPNSHVFLVFKGDALLQLNETDKALECYEKALISQPSNLKLRSTINDLKKFKNPLIGLHLTDPYNYIKSNRNTIQENNYGLNILLNQTDILNYKNGGGEYKCTLIYEVTSQNGINILKEYSLGLSGDYVIHKSEIVKPDGSTVPADRNNSTLVFEKLEIGDVVYVDYESTFTKTGRFYNDYILNHNFTSYHPTLQNIYRILTNEEKINYKILNGQVDYKVSKIGSLYIHEFSKMNSKGLNISEAYMPPFSDLTTRLVISSIESWDEIANWYSDLVIKQLRFDQTVEEVFNKIFPEGHKQLKDEEKAKRIYYYITDNFNYSHISFRQGGYIPQKPSKTIKTKLGDCKDFSSLFLTLAIHAELDAKMVLILTSDYGNNKLVMPSTDFNHCIVKVNIDGLDQYLELTSKYLPFKSIPMSLRGATSLEIPVYSNDGTISELVTLTNINSSLAEIENNYQMKLGEENSEIELELESRFTAHLATYYVDMLETKKGEFFKEALEEEIYNMCSENVVLKEILIAEHNRENSSAEFKTKLRVDLNIDKVNEMFTFKIPYFNNPYTDEIIQNESRMYEIDYKQYETANSYQESMVVHLSDNKKFIDLPKSKEYQFKDHTFKMDFNLIKPNEIQVKVSTKVGSSNILVDEYLEYKNYVQNVLDTRDTILKYQFK
ncbi:tetratricopeptide repeat protein [Hanstruepera flava]|uniref:tetratricopeptide repeat protein n=1 Tax=Hanstruepera flava TaxID=2930218 RepID=UPI002028989C|nr:tetratricopeptide repeat protein [Hanstruepera flava]